MPDVKIYSDKIFHFKSVIKNTDQLIKDIEQEEDITNKDCIQKWQEWNSDDYIFGYRKVIYENKFNSSSIKYQKIFNELNNSIKNCINEYVEMTKEDIGTISPFGISKYNTRSYMGSHVDDYEIPGKIPTVSGVLYLNSNYSGGELFFENQKVKIKPESGDMVIFPSKSPFFHESLEILHGVKYMCPIFCYRSEVL